MRRDSNPCPPMAELARKKRVRAGHRVSATKMISRTEDFLARDVPDVSKLPQLKLSLNEKLEVLKQLDEEIVGMVNEDDVSGEIEQSDEFREGIYAVAVRIECALALPTSTPPPPRSSAVMHIPPSVGSQVKLPKITLRPFDGELTSWTPFWDSFKAAVHDNHALSSEVCFSARHTRPFLGWPSQQRTTGRQSQFWRSDLETDRKLSPNIWMSSSMWMLLAPLTMSRAFVNSMTSSSQTYAA